MSDAPYFAKMPEGKYNIIVSRAGFSNTVKQVNLNCQLTDDKNIFDEIIFLTGGKKSKNHQMWQIDYKVSSEFPAPALPLTLTRSDDIPLVTADEIAVNERAVYLPSPVFSAEIEKIKNELASESTLFIVSVKVKIDKDGNVVAADAEGDFEKLFPALVESAKKARFIPVKIKGRPATLVGRLIYSFSKSDS